MKRAMSLVLAAAMAFSFAACGGASSTSGAASTASGAVSYTLLGVLVLVFGVFINPTVSQLVGITPDMWMQNRYYRNYGVIAGFLTNIQNLQVDKPEGYSEKAVQEILDKAASQDLGPEFAGSYKNKGDGAVKQPNIISVSYTHLDVYKRQQRCCPPRYTAPAPAC